MKTFLILSFIFLSFLVKSQDCVGYWDFCHNDTVNNKHDHYVLVKNDKGEIISRSTLISTTETAIVYFSIISGYDYRMSICSSYKFRPRLKLIDINTNEIVYDNTKCDTMSVIEFEMRETRSIKAILSLTDKKTIQNPNILAVKLPRYCIGLKLESMITHK